MRRRDEIRWWALTEIGSAMLILKQYPHATDTARRMQAAEWTLDLLDELEQQEALRLKRDEGLKRRKENNGWNRSST
jgi:hypothetical protein